MKLFQSEYYFDLLNIVVCFSGCELKCFRASSMTTYISFSFHTRLLITFKFTDCLEHQLNTDSGFLTLSVRTLIYIDCTLAKEMILSFYFCPAKFSLAPWSLSTRICLYYYKILRLMTCIIVLKDPFLGWDCERIIFLSRWRLILINVKPLSFRFIFVLMD